MYPLRRQKKRADVLAAFLFVVAAALPAQCRAQDLTVTSISIENSGGTQRAIIKANGELPKPRISRLDHPERLVVDLIGAVPKNGYQKTAVNTSSLIAIRTSLLGNDSSGRPITRIVFDLRQRSDYQISSSPGELTVTISDRIMPGVQSVAHSEPSTPPAKPVKQAALHEESSASILRNVLHQVSVAHDTKGTSVVLNFQNAAEPRTMHLDGRFVLDFPGAASAQGRNRTMKADSPSVRAVRSSTFTVEPPVLRVVLDENPGAPRPRVSTVGTTVRVEYSDTTLATAVPALKTASAIPEIAASATIPHNSKPPDTPEPIGGIQPNAPRVAYRNGLLSLDARNSVLADVMYAIGEKTGAEVKIPFADAMMDRVDLKMGPATARQLLATLLEGSGYTYFIVEDGSGHLQKVILTPKDVKTTN